ncbi:MAG: signal peptidase I [Verrucomicrobia bacterium]|nr:signal peptidase I [Verrucomicrobiota bacterium]
MSTRKQLKAAKELLHAAHKVYHYRRDLIGEGRVADLDKAVGELDKLCREKPADSAQIDAAMRRLDALLRKIGGKIYPKTFWSDNLEVALVAAIIVIGIRTFFFQPFIIPTNSMYPTYSGMNAEVYTGNDSAPGLLEKSFRFLTIGARHKALIAENSGAVELTNVRPVKGKKWLFFPTVRNEFVFEVDGVPHAIRVPAEFDMRSTIEQSFPNAGKRRDQNGQSQMSLNARVEAGEPILRFDITLGDALFVDRISYHFKRPEAGDPFVFRTRDIPGIEGDPRNIVDKYYIKRIGGVGGETLEITEDGVLLVDGQPRAEVGAFERNARREGEYGGYVYPKENSGHPNRILTAPGMKAKVPEGSYVALGDNSANSADSRYWGFVPEKAVIGKAIFIYYPFTKRWGPAE